MARDAAHPARRRIVHDAAQHQLSAARRGRWTRTPAVGAIRGTSAAGGLNIVSRMPSGAKICVFTNSSNGCLLTRATISASSKKLMSL